MNNEQRFKELYEIIIEYLRYHGYVETIKTFEKETQKIQRPVIKEFTIHKESIKLEMLNALERGQFEIFFNMWEKYIPQKLQTSDNETIHLDFFLHLYMATFAIRKMLDKKTHQTVNHCYDSLIYQLVGITI